MKIGVCTGTDLERIRIAKEVGFDYVESHCQNLVKASLPELDAMTAVGIPILTANCFIGLPVVGPERDDAAIKRYLEALFARAEAVGIGCLVFGSGGARSHPDGLSPAEGMQQVESFLRDLVLPLAERFQILVVIEPLRRQECNCINLVSEGAALAAKIASPYLGVLADVFHMIEGNEPLDSLPRYKDLLLHVHTSNPTPDPALGPNRTYPKKADAFRQADFLLPAIAAGVQTCSIEAGVLDFPADALEALEVLREFRDL
ncbi:MAG: sugar phosphate isomerase/epimerase [Clostridia bacterium]|nr:sugar phosphate isomerase/epimerase [Clostridia bacterium]